MVGSRSPSFSAALTTYSRSVEPTCGAAQGGAGWGGAGRGGAGLGGAWQHSREPTAAALPAECSGRPPGHAAQLRQPRPTLSAGLHQQRPCRFAPRAAHQRHEHQVGVVAQDDVRVARRHVRPGPRQAAQDLDLALALREQRGRRRVWRRRRGRSSAGRLQAGAARRLTCTVAPDTSKRRCLYLADCSRLHT
jgi:hypothetical protein